MSDINSYCIMCGAEPERPCTVISGTLPGSEEDDGLRPGMERPDLHFNRSGVTHRPAVLVPDEPPPEETRADAFKP